MLIKILKSFHINLERIGKKVYYEHCNRYMNDDDKIINKIENNITLRKKQN